ncbi:TenA family protein [Herbiconiux moechotypicola]|uniref:Thiaminase II n=1 Tax=Herbiconiux moechotypicola TaxID=637393 RepID=A0ABP5R046_9MICO|nr:TenA family protein [Herbiconiux moechotypicola]MCS5731594.1 TenA family protein [Herbiconiux moechotypicola]
MTTPTAAPTAAAPATTAELRASVGPLWQALLEHPFPAGLADASLPLERFRYYVTQNLLYLPDYARMLAVGASRSQNGVVLEEYTDALVNIVKVEIPQNERMLAGVVELAGAVPARDGVRAPATVAYTSWLLSIAANGDANDIAAALLPCAWSYGEIARGLVDGAVAHPVYSGWLAFFASGDYAAVVTTLRESFDRELAGMPEAARRRAAEIFLTGCRLERQFWDQGFSGATWSDLS